MAPLALWSQRVNFNVGGISIGVVVGTFEAQFTQMESTFQFYHNVAATVWTGVGAPFIPGLFSSL